MRGKSSISPGPFTQVSLVAAIFLWLVNSSSGNAQLTLDISAEPVEIRTMKLTYIDLDRNNLVNDYRLFGVVKEAIESTWKARNVRINISNGMTLNSKSTTSGKLGGNEYDIGIIIQTRKRLGKMIYVFNNDCETKGRGIEGTDFDLIEVSQFYSKMKQLAIRFARSCPE